MPLRYLDWDEPISYTSTHHAIRPTFSMEMQTRKFKSRNSYSLERRSTTLGCVIYKRRASSVFST